MKKNKENSDAIKKIQNYKEQINYGRKNKPNNVRPGS
jgi:hypothetical protein